MTMSLKYMANDIKAGFFVFLLALPLCLGISIASGFPPVAGIYTAVIGGIIGSIIGSARLTIKGPAAGLIVIVLGAVTELGMGDAYSGYQKTLAVGCVAAALQIVFGLVRGGLIGELIPSSVIHGMLSAIGVIIIAKQIHTMFGIIPNAKSPLGLLGEFPTNLPHLNPEVFLIGGLTIASLFFWPKINNPITKKIPAPIVALAISMSLGFYFDFEHIHTYSFLSQNYTVDPKLLISLPESFLGAITFPDFSAITSFTSIKYIVMFSLVGSIESLLTVNAVDSIDPERKTSDLNRDLLATGVGNFLASAVGGLPMISEIVRSKANVDAGAKSSTANFSHGVFLLVSVMLFPQVLHMIPTATLAAMLVFTGFRLASPHEFSHNYKIGIDQFVPFMATFILTLAVDLLVGVLVGLALQLILNISRGITLKHLFHVEALHHSSDENEYHVEVLSPVLFTNTFKFKKMLEQIGPESKKVVLNFNSAKVIEYPVFHLIDTYAKNNGKIIELRGLDSHQRVSTHEHCTRIKKAQ